MIAAPPSTATMVAFAVVLVALIIQLAAVRPALVRRSNRVLAAGSDGSDRSRSRVHYAYVVLEAVKAIALLTTGIFLLTS